MADKKKATTDDGSASGSKAADKGAAKKTAAAEPEGEAAPQIAPSTKSTKIPRLAKENKSRLIVLPIEAALEFVGEEGTSILIAPDELMKAETSGGDPYHIQVPDAAADAILQCECHHLYFVEYLRLSFRFGGFPGYEGIECPPPDLAELRADLRPF